MVFTINIEKGKIIEILDNNCNKVLAYTQIIKNKDSNHSEKIIASNLIELMSKVRSQVNEWKSSNEIE